MYNGQCTLIYINLVIDLYHSSLRPVWGMKEFERHRKNFLILIMKHFTVIFHTIGHAPFIFDLQGVILETSY